MSELVKLQVDRGDGWETLKDLNEEIPDHHKPEKAKRLNRGQDRYVYRAKHLDPEEVEE